MVNNITCVTVLDTIGLRRYNLPQRGGGRVKREIRVVYKDLELGKKGLRRP
jgi:hypothetical protein